MSPSGHLAVVVAILGCFVASVAVTVVKDPTCLQHFPNHPYDSGLPCAPFNTSDPEKQRCLVGKASSFDDSLCKCCKERSQHSPNGSNRALGKPGASLGELAGAQHAYLPIGGLDQHRRQQQRLAVRSDCPQD
uniref:Secreted protein n=1 Tax=Steinernema glaseri TaxID=37863 RepID=A0A1I8AQX6_9BILA